MDDGQFSVSESQTLIYCQPRFTDTGYLHTVYLKKTTIHEAFRDIVNALYDIRNDFIKLPMTVEETVASIGTFEHLSMLPNIARSIDGSHIKVRAPRESAVDYFSRYQQHDVVVKAVVNGRKLFIDVAAGFPGSLHDARVLRNSSIYQKAENGDILAAGPMYLIGADEIQHYLVGDSTYPLSPWLQKPYPEGTRDPGEIRFNKELSSARVLVECAFGNLEKPVEDPRCYRGKKYSCRVQDN